MNDDLRELLRLLNSHHVEYLVIGAHALAFYCEPRLTEDLDLWISRTNDNTQLLHDALEEFGTGIGVDGLKQFREEKRRIIRIGAPPSRVDILNFVDGPPFAEVWAERTSAEMGGVPVFAPSLNDMIRIKEAVGRPQDLADVARLKAVRDS